MKLELRPDGYEKLEAVIQEIENLALEGAFNGCNIAARFHQIAGKAKNLRQILQETLIIDPRAEQFEPTEAA